MPNDPLKVLKVNGATYDIIDQTARNGLSSKQDTLVSGTNIKTVNGNSLLGSGDLVISGGLTATTATLTSGGWSSNTQTVTVSGVTATNNVIVSYAPSSKDAWVNADIYCSAQGANSLTFTCTTEPTVNVSANILISS